MPSATKIRAIPNPLLLTMRLTVNLPLPPEWSQNSHPGVGGDTDSILIAPTIMTVMMPLDSPMAVVMADAPMPVVMADAPMAVVMADAPMPVGLVVVIVDESIYGTH